MPPSDAPAGEPRPSLVAALRRLLRPLVRLLVGQQVSYPFLSKLLKALYIEVAASEFGAEGGRGAVSRLSLLTGIQRREAKRLLGQAAEPDEPAPAAVTLGAQIIARWTGEAPWRDADGDPLPLPRLPQDDDSPCFHALVQSVSVDVHPRSLLDVFLELGIATVGDDDRVRLAAPAFVPTRGYDEKAYFVGRNLRDHIAAAATNLVVEPSPFLERSVFYGALPEAAVEELSALARELGQQALSRVDARARELKRAAAEAGADRGARRRISFGVYLYDAPSERDERDEGEG